MFKADNHLSPLFGPKELLIPCSSEILKFCAEELVQHPTFYITKRKKVNAKIM